MTSDRLAAEIAWVPQSADGDEVSLPVRNDDGAHVAAAWTAAFELSVKDNGRRGSEGGGAVERW